MHICSYVSNNRQFVLYFHVQNLYLTDVWLNVDSCLLLLEMTQVTERL